MRSGSRKRIYCYASKPQARLTLEPALRSEETTCAWFSSWQNCLEKLSVRPCDILIVDLDGCEAEGLELLAQARRMAPWIAAMALVEHAAVPAAVKAVKAGACECLEKPIRSDRLREVVAGHLARMESTPRSRRALTQMEIQILQLILAGRTSQDMANHLHRSKRTIDVHRKNIMRKLQACSLVDLIKQALAMGLAEDEPPGDIQARAQDNS
jgi:two-component system, LuxR family, response regulator FixJ